MAAKTKVITLSISEELLQKLDTAANEDFASRSELIRLAIVEHLRLVDEYHARLLAIAHTVQPPTEKEIEDMLRKRRLKREVNEVLRQSGLRPQGRPYWQ